VFVIPTAPAIKDTTSETIANFSIGRPSKNRLNSAIMGIDKSQILSLIRNPAPHVRKVPNPEVDASFDYLVARNVASAGTRKSLAAYQSPPSVARRID
jgi:hypothetical protein